MVDHNYLISMLEESGPSYYPKKEDFWEVLHSLSIDENSKGLEELSAAHTEFYFREYKNCFRDYSHAKSISQKDLKSYATEADQLYTNYKNQRTNIQNFVENKAPFD